MIEKFYRIVLFLLVSFLPLVTYANTLYQVEIIVFQNNQTHALTVENWLSYPPLPTTESAIRLHEYNPNDTNQTYRMLPSNRLKLNSEARRIQENPQYTLLLHTAWLQPISHPNQARPIALNNLFFSSYQNLPTLEGTITLSQQNYINLRTDLVVNIANSNYPVVHQRRLKTSSMYYLDNPVVGILIEVTPV